MNDILHINKYHIAVISAASLFFLSFTASDAFSAQNTKSKDPPHAEDSSDKSATGDQSLAFRLRKLQLKVAKLEAALKKKHAGKMDQGIEGMGGKGMKSTSGQRMSGMGMMGDKKEMMPEKGMGGKGMSGMAMMGQMKGMGKMQMPSTLPGFAGASHIYHIGATSFFLDHLQHITLAQEQQVKLNQIKEKVLLGQATSDRWISQAEQELWVLTSSDAPDAANIEAKIREIEKVRSDKRIAYIQAVGKAARILTDEQRQTLVGYLPADHNAAGAGEQN